MCAFIPFTRNRPDLLWSLIDGDLYLNVYTSVGASDTVTISGIEKPLPITLDETSADGSTAIGDSDEVFVVDDGMKRQREDLLIWRVASAIMASEDVARSERMEAKAERVRHAIHEHMATLQSTEVGTVNEVKVVDIDA